MTSSKTALNTVKLITKVVFCEKPNAKNYEAVNRNKHGYPCIRLYLTHDIRIQSSKMQDDIMTWNPLPISGPL